MRDLGKIAMRFISVFLLCFFFGRAFSATNLDSPRSTFKTFLKAMVDVKENRSVEDAYERAASALDLSWVDPAAKKEAGRKASEALVGVLDKLERIEYENIPEEIQGDDWIYDKRTVKIDGEPRQIEIRLGRKDGKWLFTKATLDSLSAYSRALKEKEIVAGVVKLSTWREKLRESLPDWSKEAFFGIALWQWIGLLLLTAVAYLIEKSISVVSRTLIHKNSVIFKNAPKDLLKNSTIPFGKIILLYIVLANLYWLDLEPAPLAVIKRGIYVLSALAAVWFGHRLVELVSYFLKEKAKATVSKFDDIMIPLVTKTSFILVYIAGALLVLSSLTVNVTGLLAGLGIGGLAFAFAAKDTLANFFGSIMLVLDRPFDIGDVIVSGDIEGTVVEVGFRSTRIRTFYDSIITVSNGELMNRSIDNWGKRRYRRLSTTLGLEYDTPAEKVEAFCEGVRQLILSHKHTRKDYFNVYFTNFGASSLDIQLMVFWETADYTREQQEKHRLMVDILRLAKELEIGFAFPTQTVHLFQESTKTEHKFGDAYFEEGAEKAKRLVAKPLSFENPRSNFNDENQFGKNKVGG